MSANSRTLQCFFNAMKCLKGEAAPLSFGEVSGLRLELTERDAEISRLRKEYALLREHAREQAERAVDETIEKIILEAAAPLANVGAMQARHLEKGGLNLDDLLSITASLGKILTERGMEQIGCVGERMPYDVALHQMLDGSHPQPPQQVRIRFSGFRFKGKLMAKAKADALHMELDK
ncbi:MAG: nucleotide exchange factor GrpE [Candidatus Chlorobium antarcticum]|nr:nucleotide exchange factor GrpE [Candidatus Chlorobium antarcticum]